MENQDPGATEPHLTPRVVCNGASVCIEVNCTISFPLSSQRVSFSALSFEKWLVMWNILPSSSMHGFLFLCLLGCLVSLLDSLFQKVFPPRIVVYVDVSVEMGTEYSILSSCWCHSVNTTAFIKLYHWPAGTKMWVSHVLWLDQAPYLKASLHLAVVPASHMALAKTGQVAQGGGRTL